MKPRLVQALVLLLGTLLTGSAVAQHWLHDDGSRENRSIFRALDWPAPNAQRNAAGAPGEGYWQQQADYDVDVRLDTVNHMVTGSERITYHNNAPDVLRYVWIQLDQNVRSLEHSRSYAVRGALPERISPAFRRYVGLDPFDGGYTLSRVQVADASGDMVDARHRINNTVMRVDLVEPLGTGESVAIDIDWGFPVPTSGRGGRERVADGWLYLMAQWFPRMSVYDDVNGWQTDQFLGQGEFYLNFGDYDVRITVPWNHIVESTGELQNPRDVLTREQIRRLERAYTSEEPSFIVGPDEVMDPATRPVRSGMLTWHYKAQNVRDFAWASSKAFVWDAAGFRYAPDGPVVKVHSMYPREAMPLWDKVSTRATVQTLKTYGRMAFPYPYPKATNINGPVGGMEYPMVAFCGRRPNPDGSYSDGMERSLIGVTIHEVGHNWYPMIVASDERKWTWMDEGLNTFVQYYAEQDYAKTYCGTVWTQTEDCTYPSRRGPAENIVGYMRDPDQVPIMTESDLIHKDFGNNGYAKPATGLVMLREKILGPVAFDDAFSGYSKAWAFGHPQPADFFRQMDEGAGEDLAWYWRGWFYTSHANDQALTAVSMQQADSLLGSTDAGAYYYRVQVANEGGLVMPLEFEVTYDDGSTERFAMPADVWRRNELSFTKGFFSDRKVHRIRLDPDAAYADIDPSDNYWEAPEIRSAEDPERR